MLALRGHAVAAALAVGALPAAGAEFVLGLGADDIVRSAVPALGFEVRAEPRWHFGAASVGLGLAGEIDGDGDAWGGAGVVLTAPLAPDWRFEASFMPGAYAEGSGNDLGASFPMFRTQVGVSYQLPTGWRAGVAINHKSNANTAPHNPGVETVFLTFGREF